MYCPKCGKENPDDAPLCSSCGWALSWAPTPDSVTSRMAIASLILGILSLFTCGITAIPAVILGIIALVQIGKSGGRLTGEGFAIVGMVVPVVVFFLMMGILMPALLRTKAIAFRVVCGTNLSGIGKATRIYANDFDGEFPQAGGARAVWAPSLPNWQGDNRFQAYNLNADGTGGQVTVASSFYLLVKYSDVGVRQFLCKGTDTTEFKLANYGITNLDLIDVWDFGPSPIDHCSYSYHAAYDSPFALTTARSPPGMAVAADRNPWLDPAADAGYRDTFSWNGDTNQQKAGNAIAHGNEGQNVLFLDGHVAFEKRSFCGIQDDNIYTACVKTGEIQQGITPLSGPAAKPLHREDSLLVNEGEITKPPPH